MFLTGEPQYPAERTLLVSGAIDLVMQSKAEGGRVVQTPDALAEPCSLREWLLELKRHKHGSDWAFTQLSKFSPRNARTISSAALLRISCNPSTE